MKAFTVKKYGKKETLHLSNVAEPVVKDNEVLIQIHSAGLNMLDSIIKNGEFKLFIPYKTPFVNGHDMAGVITKVGLNVKRFQVELELLQFNLQNMLVHM